MALAYTAPTWEDGSGTGISASQLQALCNCVEGLVQGTDKAVHNITFSGSTMTLTFADGSQETAATSVKGISSISKTGTSGNVDTYTITYSDGTTSSFTVTNGSSPVISATATTDAQSSPTPTVNVTKSGTDAAPSFAFAFSGLKGTKGDTGATGADGYSPAVAIGTITGGHTVTITDASHPTGQTFNVMDGAPGAGDMDSSVYDSDSAVANAGGIASYVSTNAMAKDGSNSSSAITLNGSSSFTVGSRKSGTTTGSGSIAIGSQITASGENSAAIGYYAKASNYWSTALGSNAEANGVASTATGSLSQANGDYSFATGRHTIAGYARQAVVGAFNDNKSTTMFEVGNGSADNSRSNAFEVYTNGDVNVTGQILRNGAPEYLENNSVTLSTSGTTTVTFTNAAITANSVIQYACTQWDIVPDDITATTGSCTVTMPQVDSAVTVGVRIYLR